MNDASYSATVASLVSWVQNVMAAVDDELLSYAASGAPANTSADEAYYKARDDAIVVAIWTSILMYALVSNIIVILGILRNASMRKVCVPVATLVQEGLRN